MYGVVIGNGGGRSDDGDGDVSSEALSLGTREEGIVYGVEEVLVCMVGSTRFDRLKLASSAQIAH